MEKTVDRRKGVHILLIAGQCFVFIFVASTPFAVAEVTASDMLVEIEGYTLEAGLYTYAEYVAMMEEIGIVPSDFILGETPVTIILASYSKGAAYVWYEVIEFASEEDAMNEYDLQAVDTEYISGLGYQGNNGPLYQRFSPRERVFFHGRFLYYHRLEPTFQSCIFFNMFSIFIECCCAYCSQFATCQSRF